MSQSQSSSQSHPQSLTEAVGGAGRDVSDDVNLDVGHLRLPEFLVEPDQLTGGISGGGKEPQVEVVTEVAVEGDQSQAGLHLNSKSESECFLVKISPADFVGEVAGFGHHLLGGEREPGREIFGHRAVEPEGGLLSRDRGGKHVDGKTLVIPYGRQDGNVGEIFPELFHL